MHSKKLAAHFESNPEDLQMLRHDKPLTKTRKLAHLAHVPTYLKPETDGATAEVAAIGSSSRRLPEKRRKLYGGKGKHAKSKRDPLKSFKSAGGPKQRKGRKAAKARAGAKPTGS